GGIIRPAAAARLIGSMSVRSHATRHPRGGSDLRLTTSVAVAPLSRAAATAAKTAGSRHSTASEQRAKFIVSIINSAPTTTVMTSGLSVVTGASGGTCAIWI